jgi:diphthamide biosynthesis enzyme Dph1/Dph2-like protein
MEVLFLEARKKFKGLNLEVLADLPGKTISIGATIQYLSLIPKVRKYLESIGKKVTLRKGPAYAGHVLGCNPSALDVKADTILMITDGKFHALNNSININREIYVFNTFSLEKVTREEINQILGKKKAALKRFLAESSIGILVSTKPGQSFPAARKLQKDIEKMGKKAFIFEGDNIDTSEFENFPINIWVNTACFGLGLDDSRIVNLQDIIPFLTRN